MTFYGNWEKYKCVIAQSLCETHSQCICGPCSTGSPLVPQGLGSSLWQGLEARPRKLHLSQDLSSLKILNSGLLYSRQILQNQPVATVIDPRLADNLVVLKIYQATPEKHNFLYISLKNEEISSTKLCEVHLMSIESMRKQILEHAVESSPSTTCYIQNGFFLCCFK